MGTVQLAEGEEAGPGLEKSGCRLLGSCAQTVCQRHSSWLPSGAILLELGRATPALLPWPYLSYCNWRLISRGIWDLPPARHVAGSGAGLRAGRKMGEPRLRLQPGRLGSGETGLSLGHLGWGLLSCLAACLPLCLVSFIEERSCAPFLLHLKWLWGCQE